MSFPGVILVQSDDWKDALRAPSSSPKAAAYHSPVLGRVRYLVDTVFGQLTDRCGIKRVWVHDVWHLRNRLLRAVLMHTIGFFFNQQDQAPCSNLTAW
jgi:hypothetical protein